jgi:type I restriction enzyme S subunit
MSNVPIGSHKTDFGLLPLDWSCLSLGELVNDVSYGSSAKSATKGLIPVLRMGNLQGGFIDWNGLVYTSVQDEINKYSLKKNDVLFNRTNTVDLVGKTSIYRGEQPAIYAGYLIKINCKEQLLNSEYLNYVLNTHRIKAYNRLVLSVAVSQANINGQKLKTYPIPLPPTLEEQAAIASALSDVDTLLSELEKLFAKKQAIKTATMQQLLTGKTRLPAFAFHKESTYAEDDPEAKRKGQAKGTKPSELGEIPEDWQIVGFGDLFERNISRKKISPESEVTFVGMQDVSEDAKIVTPSKIIYKSVKSGFTYFEQNDVLVAKITPCFENGKGCFTDILPTKIGFGSTEFHVLRASKSTSAKYIYYISITDKFRNELESEMVGSAGHRRVPLDAIQSYQIPVSKNKKEQTAIANILCDMDEEIQALKQRLTKTRQIKQGMMQELLTGKTRLPFDNTEAQDFKAGAV